MKVIFYIKNLIGAKNFRQLIYYILIFGILSTVYFAITLAIFLLTNTLLNNNSNYFKSFLQNFNDNVVNILSTFIIIFLCVYELCNYYFQNILSLDTENFYSHNFNDYVRLCFHSSQDIVYLLHLFKETCLAIFTMLLSLVLLMNINLYLIWGFLVLFIIYFAFKFNSRKRNVLTNIGFENVNYTKNYYNYLDDIFNIFREIKIFKQEKIAIEIEKTLMKDIAKSNVVLAKQTVLASNHIQSVLIIGILLSILFVHNSKDSLLSIIPILIIVLLSIQKIIPAINSAFLFFNHLNSSKYLIWDGNKVFNENYHTEKVTNIISNFDCIHVKNASFGYSEKMIFENFEFKIKANHIIGVLGESGKGKTTFIEILMGARDYLSSYISIDGQLITSFSQLSSIVSYVPQKVYLMQNTLRNNLTLFNRDFSDNELWEVLEKVNLKEYFLNLNDKLETKIKKNGENLSIGQAQRIGIARALLYKSKLLILDEFSASLDLENKLLINKILLKIKSEMTIVIVTHDSEVFKILDYSIYIK